MGFESIIERIDSLPPLPESLVKLEELYAKGGIPDPKDLVKIIESDSVLTANILAYVNVPFYGFSKEIVSVFQAIVLFGSTTIRGFALSSFVKNSFEFNLEPYGIDTKTFQKVSTLQSSFMFQWYMRVDMERAKFVVPVSFLMEIGKIIIAREVIESSQVKNFHKEIKAGTELTKVENDFVGMSSAKVTSLLFEHWHFNDYFVNSVRYLDEPQEAPKKYLPLTQALDVVQTCINVKDIVSEKSIEAARQKVEKYDLPLSIFDRTIDRWKSKIED